MEEDSESQIPSSDMASEDGSESSAQTLQLGAKQLDKAVTEEDAAAHPHESEDLSADPTQEDSKEESNDLAAAPEEEDAAPATIALRGFLLLSG